MRSRLGRRVDPTTKSATWIGHLDTSECSISTVYEWSKHAEGLVQKTNRQMCDFETYIAFMHTKIRDSFWIPWASERFYYKPLSGVEWNGVKRIQKDAETRANKKMNE